MKLFKSARHQQLNNMTWFVWLIASVMFLLCSSCGSSVDVSFRLVPPCSDPSVLTGANCQFIKITVSSLDPSDPLHPSQVANNLGPRRTTCNMSEGHCKISGDDLVGAGRMVDVLCYPSLDVAPVARATSQSLLLDSSPDGVGGLKASLLLGNILGFVETTVTDPADPEFSKCSLMAESAGRYGHAAVTLQDGRVLITGGMRRFGQGVEEILATAEIFDPGTGIHRLILGPDGQALKMFAGRAYHTMTLLRDGRVLIVGGIGLVSNAQAALRSAEIFDPVTETFTSPMDMGVARAHHTATTLATGQVLIAGGATYSNGSINNYLNSATIFDPNSGTWTAVSNTMSTGRAFHQAVLLDPTTTQGKVLIIGGENANGTLSSVDIFNPNGLQFYSGVDVTMSTSRSRFCAVRLQSGRVLVAGGTTVADDPGTADFDFSPDNGVEVYDISSGGEGFGAFASASANLNVARMGQSCAVLEDGSVVVAGGLTGSGQATGVGELIRDNDNVYTVEQLPDPLDPERFEQAAVLLKNGWFLLTGGLSSSASDATALRQSVLFVPQPANP